MGLLFKYCLAWFQLRRSIEQPSVIIAVSADSDPRDLPIRGNLIPANPRICRYRENSCPWQNSPAPMFRGVFSQQFSFQKFIDKPREFIQFYRIFRKFIISGRSVRLRHRTRSPPCSRRRRCGQMRALASWKPKPDYPASGNRIARKSFRILPSASSPATANARKCAYARCGRHRKIAAPASRRIDLTLSRPEPVERRIEGQFRLKKKSNPIDERGFAFLGLTKDARLSGMRQGRLRG